MNYHPHTTSHYRHSMQEAACPYGQPSQKQRAGLQTTPLDFRSEFLKLLTWEALTVLLSADLAFVTSGELAGMFRLVDFGCRRLSTLVSIGDSQANRRSEDWLGSSAMIGQWRMCWLAMNFSTPTILLLSLEQQNLIAAWHANSGRLMIFMTV